MLLSMLKAGRGLKISSWSRGSKLKLIFYEIPCIIIFIVGNILILINSIPPQ